MNKKKPTIKRFNAWTKLKRGINNSSSIPAGYKEREIWWIALGHNVGVEEDGKNENFDRPVLIVKGFSKYLFWGVPLSTTEKRGPYYHPIMHNGITSVALLSQLRTFDTRRLISKHGMISHKDFGDVKQKLRDFFRIKFCPNLLEGAIPKEFILIH